ncbi:hypothetical protein B0T14DRAFT_567361 [Immersiella caudata]|uniref:CENP-V/GFA domain-containing protein n=1 Tax=Immersiella caudata TaxID=314043 RepID=A0AA39WS71_9PEZI|nr:hypothetical protein B0T14DRAFT_567361 [Immersiella caudata]
MASEPTKTLTAQCYCKSTRFTVTVPTSALPLGTHLCSCFICRQVHGTLACFHAPLPTGTSPVFLTPTISIIRYRHSDLAASDRLFCSTCGCHIGDEDIIPDHASGQLEWRVASSIFTEHDESTFQIRSHIFPPTTSVGLHTWLPEINNRKLSSWAPEPNDPNFPILPPPTPTQEFDSDGHERLRGECHCGGVSFTFPRPNHPSFKDDPLVKRYTSPADPQKWLACMDVCNDCRLLTGAHVTAWTFIPLSSISPPLPESLEGYGTLKTYRSSEKVLRGFCGRCGATVFYMSEEERRKVDVAVGILRAPEGAIAEKWLTWRTGKLTYERDGMEFDRVFAEGLKRGLRTWGEGLDGEVLDFEIPLIVSDAIKLHATSPKWPKSPLPRDPKDPPSKRDCCKPKPKTILLARPAAPGQQQPEELSPPVQNTGRITFSMTCVFGETPAPEDPTPAELEPPAEEPPSKRLKIVTTGTDEKADEKVDGLGFQDVWGSKKQMASPNSRRNKDMLWSLIW